MDAIRQTAVAGQFYPGEALELGQLVDQLLAAEKTAGDCPKVIIAPHAGYIYSGSTAAKAYARVANGRNRISRVVVLGPAHRIGFRGMALSDAGVFATPLGEISIDEVATEQIRALPSVVRLASAHAQEHSLEVQLPFLQRCLDHFTLVPIVVGECSADDAARVIEALWGGPETLIVLSTDLSHFLDYERAQQKDANTSRQILACSNQLSADQACGANPLNGLLQVLSSKNLPISQLQVVNSGDTAGDKNRVVGYGAFVVNEPSQVLLGIAERQQLLFLARNAILGQLTQPGNFEIKLDQYDPSLRRHLASFVTLKINGRLRGCIGSLAAHRDLVIDVAHNAIAAALQDRRFKPLTLEEYRQIDLHLSVLSPPYEVDVKSREELVARLRPGMDGLILQQEALQATYLPSVWDQIPDPEQFVGELRVKAGLPRTGWSEQMKVSFYTTEEFS
ncbi:MAG: AmmeMemoRadiSam system protein B [Gammaproteobacteria bacterium]|jgi:MEMO1 family protein|nr:AmmeMemoRadiSam system protein B [Gammaproteobacteria bacterium]MBT5202415.1 AmmeMemoRadiSam system protein B [Gammaproteobacteria bacterium]MBT5601625.1 AmmeMemoRadiSam system protein B [Gammaproteobacteria bacterium]MBT6246836.1 AmmeMemoRadiSam system protein B [Gammaproteobacteria bacterium]